MSPTLVQELKAIARPKVPGAFGPVWQLGYVPGDLKAALHYWTQVMGAGPFLLREQLVLADVRYRDQPCDIRFGAALGYWGDVNIELIFQTNDAPSIYRHWANGQDRDRLHHMGFLVDDLSQSVETALRLGGEVVQEAGSKDGKGGLAYVDFGPAAPHGYLEFVQMNDAWRESHAWLRRQAVDWDGRDPVRLTTS